MSQHVIELVGQDGDAFYVNAAHIIWVKNDLPRTGSQILLSTGYGTLHVTDSPWDIRNAMAGAK